MKLKISVLLFLFMWQFSFHTEAQSDSAEPKDARQLLDLAKEQMAAEDFTAANKTFRKMLDLKTTLPNEMCYFFASTLFMLGQHENSLRFAEKYEKLTGTGGEFYQDTQKLKALLNAEREKILSCSVCDNQGYVLHDCRYCEGQGHFEQSCLKCLGNKHVKCKSCDGEGVKIAKNHFGQSNYNTCSVCEGNGFQECSFCEGSGEKKQSCRYCSGSGSMATNEICNHPQEAAN